MSLTIPNSSDQSRVKGEVVAYKNGKRLVYDHTVYPDYNKSTGVEFGHIVMPDGSSSQELPLISVLSKGYWKSEPEDSIEKHLGSKHDQMTHGRRVSGFSSEEFAAHMADAKLNGSRIGLNDSTLAMFEKWAAKKSSDNQIKADEEERQRKLGGPTRLSGREPDYQLEFSPDEQYDILEKALARRKIAVEKADQRFEGTPEDKREKLVENFQKIQKEGTVMIAVPAEDVTKVLTDAKFKTQFETADSQGVLAEERRALEETKNFDLHPNVDASLRPVYGYVAMGNLTGHQVSLYGGVRFELEDSVKERTTFTDGDSLGSNIIPVPMSGPITQTEAVGALSDWKDSGIFDGFVSDYNEKDVSGFVDSRYDYVEAQIRGGVDLRSVKKIHLPQDVDRSIFVDFHEEILDNFNIEVVSYE